MVENSWPGEISITAYGEMLNELHGNKASRFLKFRFVLYLAAGTEDRKAVLIKLQKEPVNDA